MMQSQWEGYFAQELRENDLSTYSHIRKFVQKKVDYVLEHPYAGEPLKYSLDGLRSVPVKGSYIMIYMIYEEWKEKGNEEIQGWSNLKNPEKAVIFLTVKPHDPAYEYAEDWSQLNLDRII